MYHIIPITTAPDQTFTISLPANSKNIELLFRVRYNTEAKYWTIGIVDTDGNQIIDSVPLLVGEYPAANILSQLKYLNIGSLAIVPIGTPTTDSPDDTNLGKDFLLIAGDTDEF